MKKYVLFAVSLLTLSGCAQEISLPANELVLLEKPGSRALAEGINLRHEGKHAAAQKKFLAALEALQEPPMRAVALNGLADIAGAEKNAAAQAEYLRQAAALGDVKATYRAAWIQRTKVTPETVALLTQMAEQKTDADAMLALARIEQDGLAGTADPKAGEHWYRRAIAAGSLTAAAELGRLWAAEDSGVPPEHALALLAQVAAHDPTAVARDLAGIYERQGNAREAVAWYGKAASGAQPGATVYTKLAQAYAAGWGVEADAPTALYWRTQAAQAGSVNATEAVMRAHFNGEGTAPNADEGERWLNILLTRKPERRYGIAKDFAAGDGLPQSLPRAFSLALEAAQAGDIKAMRYVAYAYTRGTGTQANLTEANRWFDAAGIPRPTPKQVRAARPRAHPLLAKAAALEAEGKPDQALALYETAAGQGDTQAMLKLGAAHATGLGTPPDAQRSAAWFAKAAALGNPEAQYRIGVSYARGNGVEKDTQKAQFWLEKAAKNGYPLAADTLQTILAKKE